MTGSGANRQADHQIYIKRAESSYNVQAEPNENMGSVQVLIDGSVVKNNRRISFNRLE